MVKEHGPDIIQMPIQGEQAPPCLIRPYLDLVVVAARHEKRLCLVEIDATNGAVVLFKAVNQCSHAIVPKLNRRGMEGDEDPWSAARQLRSKGQRDSPTVWDEMQCL